MNDDVIQQLMRVGRLSEARSAAERAVAGVAHCTPVHALLAAILLQQNRPLDARSVVETALSLGGGSADAYDGLGYVATQLGLHDAANSFYRRAVAAAPTVARHWHNVANSERGFGRLAAAEEACTRAIELDPTHYPSFLLRSEMRLQTPQSSHVSELERRLQDATLNIHGQIYLRYSLAKELDDLQRYADAFGHFSTAARLRRSLFNYDVRQDEGILARLAQVFAAPNTSGASGLSGLPCVFVVGLPRSGTTLVERILTSLSGVRSNGETNNFSRALTQAAPPGKAEVFERAARADAAKVATAYRQLARIGTGETVVEKLPTNYLYVGAILNTMPDAKIVLLERSPLDACFAMYRSLFGDAYPFSYDFEELARYTAAYRRLMTHWRTVYGNAIHCVSYEALVQDPSTVGEQMAAFCGLRWRPGAVDIQHNSAVSLTASASQVRRPIYGTSSGRWRRYHDSLRPLIDALHRHGVPAPADA